MFELRSAVLTSMKFKRKVLRDVHILHIYKPKSAIAVNSHSQSNENEMKTKWNKTLEYLYGHNYQSVQRAVQMHNGIYMAQSKQCFKKIAFPRLILLLLSVCCSHGHAQYHLFALSCASYYMMLILSVGWTIVVFVVVYKPDRTDTVTKIHPKWNETHKIHTVFFFCRVRSCLQPN